MHLTSTKNPLIQTIRRAAAAGRPTEDGFIVVEGPHLIEEALRGEWQIKQVFATSTGRERYAKLLQRADAEVIELSPRAFASAAATDAPQEVFALLQPRTWSWEDLLGESPMIVALDGIQDPGNAGTIVRSAEAFEATGVVFLTGCVRVSNGKLLRATAGSMFRLPFLETIDPAELIDQSRRYGIRIYALTSAASAGLTAADFRARCALAVGSEGRGLSRELLAEASAISIPTANVESLNVAIASSIALFEAHRQRNEQ